MQKDEPFRPEKKLSATINLWTLHKSVASKIILSFTCCGCILSSGSELLLMKALSLLAAFMVASCFSRGGSFGGGVARSFWNTLDER